jgi:hypothetical protein
MSLFQFFRRARKSTALLRKAPQSRRSARVCLDVEAMEERAVPAIVLSGTTLSLYGDQLGSAFNDTITVDHNVLGGVSVSIIGAQVEAASYNPSDVTAINIYPEFGNNTVNVFTTAVPVTIQSASLDTVNLGNSLTGVQGITAGVSVSNPPSFTVLNIDDRADTVGRTATLTAGSLSGLAPGTITFRQTDLSALNIYGDAAGNTFTVQGTPSISGATYLSAGAGLNHVNVQATGGTLYLDGGAGDQVVSLGSLAPNSGGTLAGIQGTVGVYNSSPNGSSQLFVQDAGDTAAETVSLADGALSNLAPASIVWADASPATGLGGVNRLAVFGSRGPSTYDVLGTGAGVSTSVTGGAGSDTFIVSPGAQNLDALAGPLTLTGGGGTNSLTLDDQGSGSAHGYTLTATTLARTGAGLVTYGGFSTLAVNGAASGGSVFVVSAAPAATTVTLNGGGGSNALFGPNAAQTWNVTGADAGNLGSKLLFTDIHDLVGGRGNDTFKFLPGGSISGIVAGGGGMNKLDYTMAGVSAVVDLATAAATWINGGAADGFSGIQSLAASPAFNNALLGPDSGTTWTISAPNAGKVDTVAFTGFGELVGGAGVDIFKFTANGSVGLIDGGGAPAGKGNWLDYSGLLTPVTVNLQTNSATRVGSGAVGHVFEIQDVHGSNGGSTLVGDNQGNILIGGSGADAIIGGGGASLLIGDKGADQIFGGSGSDILIGDATVYDAMTAANENALMGILAEWQSGDLQAVKFHDINTGTGGGLNGSAKLKFGTTVKDDLAADTLTAAPEIIGFDWFFQGKGDAVQNFLPGDHLNNT